MERSQKWNITIRSGGPQPIGNCNCEVEGRQGFAVLVRPNSSTCAMQHAPITSQTNAIPAGKYRNTGGHPNDKKHEILIRYEEILIFKKPSMRASVTLSRL